MVAARVGAVPTVLLAWDKVSIPIETGYFHQLSHANVLNELAKFGISMADTGLLLRKVDKATITRNSPVSTIYP